MAETAGLRLAEAAEAAKERMIASLEETSGGAGENRTDIALKTRQVAMQTRVSV
jgi:hypothetical protein